MLKVVGASTEKTRACSYILASLLLIGFGVVLFSGRIGDMNASTFDETYSATVYWSASSGYRVEFWGQGRSPAEVAAGVARALYTHGLPATGWSRLEIQTNGSYSDSVQAYAAGFLEGSLTWQLVHWRWSNTIEAVCARAETRCARVRERLRAASDATRARAEHLSAYYPFWHQVRLFYEQLDGMEAGWWYAVRRNKRNIDIPAEDFLWLNVGAELLLDSASVDSFAFITLSNDTVNVAHSTAAMYGDMLRIVKSYSFNYHETGVANSKLVPGSKLIFTGYPGSVTSRDNLYITGPLVVVGGARHLIDQRTAYSDLVRDTVLALAATRLARDGRSWAGHYMSKRSDPGVSTQWAVIDMSRLASLHHLQTSIDDNSVHDKIVNSQHDKVVTAPSGLLWVVERLKSADLSTKLYQSGFWAGRGAEDVADVYTRSDENFTTSEDMLSLVRQMVRQSPCSKGGRGDLCPIRPVPYGFIDTKVVTGTSQDASFSLKLNAISGPIYLESEEADVPPFSWSASMFGEVPHVGQPDLWNFPIWTPAWAWK